MAHRDKPWRTRFKCKDEYDVWHEVGLSLDGTHVLKCSGGAACLYAERRARRYTNNMFEVHRC